MSIDLLRCALPAEPRPDTADAVLRPRLRDAVVEALAAGRAQPKAAGAAMSAWFRRAKRFGSKERPILQAAVYGIVRHEMILVRAGARSPEALVEGWARLVGGDRFPELDSGTPAEDFATALSIDWFVAKEWLDVLGPEEAARFGAAQAQEAPTVLRANLLRCTRDVLARRLAKEGLDTTPTALAPHGLVAHKRVPWGTVPAWKDGWFEVQDESSQLFVEALGVQPGMTVWDACAGAGGKSLAFAAAGARVFATDIRDEALDELEERAARARALVLVEEPDEADLVVVDAPCSGTGRLRRDPALRWGLEAGRHVALQQELLEAASTRVAPGGRLAYATCSLLRAENVHSLDGWAVDAERTLWPHREGTDGFHWTLYRRSA